MRRRKTCEHNGSGRILISPIAVRPCVNIIFICVYNAPFFQILQLKSYWCILYMRTI